MRVSRDPALGNPGGVLVLTPLGTPRQRPQHLIAMRREQTLRGTAVARQGYRLLQLKRARMIDDDELDALSAVWHQGHVAYQAGEPVGANPYRLGLARDYWLDGWQTARYEARPPEIKPQRRWGGRR